MNDKSSSSGGSSRQPKPTPAMREMLRLAREDVQQGRRGNPWPYVGASQRAGGAKARMFKKMQDYGWFDSHNCITISGLSVK